MTPNTKFICGQALVVTRGFYLNTVFKAGDTYKPWFRQRRYRQDAFCLWFLESDLELVAEAK